MNIHSTNVFVRDLMALTTRLTRTIFSAEIRGVYSDIERSKEGDCSSDALSTHFLILVTRMFNS